MGAEENKAATEAAYKAFRDGDGEGAMANMDDGIVWSVAGDNALTGTYRGKQEVGELWGRLAGEGFATAPHVFLAEGDKVVVLTTVTLAGESSDAADVLSFGPDGKLIAFETRGDPSAANRVFPE
jgi:ketosteroid isomerase-like protein